MPTIVSGSNGVSFSTWTTASRPSSPINGQFGYNTTLGLFEGYANGAWTAVNFTLPPVNTVAPVVSGTAAINQTLSVTNGTWTNSPTSYTYQWLANSVAITSNATSNTFVLTATQVGANISCNVTAVNIAGNATATSNQVGPVVSVYSLAYLSVAGGGGATFGGGGAGGLLSNASVTVTPGDVFTMTVGAGGSTSTNGSFNGANTTITSTTSGFVSVNCVGGGNTSGANYGGVAGGSGGGGWYTGSGGAGTAGQGNNGGAGNPNGGPGGGSWTGGGGGGAGAVGANAGGGSGAGGIGVQSSITGAATYYAGGGGGGNAVGGQSGYGASGGSGGGGAGSNSAYDGGTSGTANTGGGGGGGTTSGAGTYCNGQGGSGVVIISVPTSRFSNTYTGSNVVVTTSGSNTIVKFNSSGTYTA